MNARPALITLLTARAGALKWAPEHPEHRFIPPANAGGTLSGSAPSGDDLANAGGGSGPCVTLFAETVAPEETAGIEAADVVLSGEVEVDGLEESGLLGFRRAAAR